jgi:hypothetical protein
MTRRLSWARDWPAHRSDMDQDGQSHKGERSRGRATGCVGRRGASEPSEHLEASHVVVPPRISLLVRSSSSERSRHSGHEQLIRLGTWRQKPGASQSNGVGKKLRGGVLGSNDMALPGQNAKCYEEATGRASETGVSFRDAAWVSVLLNMNRAMRMRGWASPANPASVLSALYARSITERRSAP